MQEGDYTPVYDMGKALMTLQRAFGLIPRVIGKGDSAKVRCRPRVTSSDSPQSD